MSEERQSLTIKIPSLDAWRILTLIVLLLVIVNFFMLNSMSRNVKNITGNIIANQPSEEDDVELQEEIEKPTTTTQPTQPPQEQQPQENQPVGISIDDDDSMGSDDAPVTIIEFSDYQCPYCVRFWSETLPQLKKDYISTGKVRFVFRDFSLSFHQNAEKAAEASECAGEQGKFWEMHDKIFGTQAASIDDLKKHASDIGLDTTKFNECLDSGKMASEVQKDLNDGIAAGVTGTPAFFFNGQLVTGAQPFEVFQQILEYELS